jgi:type I restriction enzyme S subunit
MKDKNNIPQGYKDSVVGIIPEEWEVTTLGNLVFITSGESPSIYRLEEKGKYPYIKVEDMNNCEKFQFFSREYSNDVRSLIQKGSIIFPKRGAAILNNKVRIAGCEIYMDSNMMAITPRKDVCGDYLYFKIIYEKLFKIADTSTIPQINNKHIIPYKLALPPLAEQIKIAEILCTWDDAIEKQSKLIEKLGLRKRGLMQRLLTGKTRFPGSTEPWKKIKLGEICNITTGRLDANAMVSNGEYPFFTCAKEVYKINNYSFDTEALLVSGNGEYVGYVHYYKGKFNAYQRTYVLDGFNCNIFYMYYALKQYLPKRIMRTKSNSNTPYIVKDTLFDMELLLPSDVEQELIAEVLTSADKEIETQRKILEVLRQQKRGLMQQLLTGKIRITI